MPQCSTSPSGAQPSPRLVRCVKLGRELPGLPVQPFPDALGRRLYDEVSLEAWRLWLDQSKMLVNEHRLNLSTPEARRFLMEQCERFFFGEGAAPPPEYRPPS